MSYWKKERNGVDCYLDYGIDGGGSYCKVEMTIRVTEEWVSVDQGDQTRLTLEFTHLQKKGVSMKKTPL